MMELLGRLPDALRGGLDNVIAGALAGGGPEPSWVAADDGSGAWVEEVATRSGAERARGVVAAASLEAVVIAQRLGVGGALWLPPSFLAVMGAFETAAETEVTVLEFDPAVVEVLGSDGAICILSFADREFWRVQLGDRALAVLLTDLATAVGAPAAVLPWPALVLGDRAAAGASKSWRELASECGGAIPTLAATSLTVRPMGKVGMPDAAFRALLEGATEAGSTGSTGPHPVHELPQGRRVGWWARECGEKPAGGWLARPSEVGTQKCRWALDGEGGAGTVEEVLSETEVAEAEGVAAVRVPGWACAGLRSGAPAGLLVARLAEEAARRGLPLWIPNLDDEGLRFVLGLPGRLWVDGAAVPTP